MVAQEKIGLEMSREQEFVIPANKVLPSHYFQKIHPDTITCLFVAGNVSTMPERNGLKEIQNAIENGAENG